jgi:hypothetical protein
MLSFSVWETRIHFKYLRTLQMEFFECPIKADRLNRPLPVYILNEATTHAGVCELNGRIKMVNGNPFESSRNQGLLRWYAASHRPFSLTL